MSSSGSPPRNSSFDLRLIPASAQHESTSPASNLSRASARTLLLCLLFLRRQHCCAIHTLRCAAPQPFSLRSPTETESHPQQPQPRKRSGPAHPHTNPIGSREERLPSSRCIWSARPKLCDRDPLCSGRSRYSPKTSRYQSGQLPRSPFERSLKGRRFRVSGVGSV